MQLPTQKAYWSFPHSITDIPNTAAVSGSSIAAISALEFKDTGNVTVLALDGTVLWANFASLNGQAATILDLAISGNTVASTLQVSNSGILSFGYQLFSLGTGQLLASRNVTWPVLQQNQYPHPFPCPGGTVCLIEQSSEQYQATIYALSGPSWTPSGSASFSFPSMIDDYQVYAAPVLAPDNETLVLASVNITHFFVSALKGPGLSRQWTVSLPTNYFIAPPIVGFGAGGEVVLNCGASLIALDISSGKTIWSQPAVNSNYYQSVAVSTQAGVVVAQLQTGQLSLLNIQDGSQLTQPLLLSGTLLGVCGQQFFASAEDDNVYAYNISTAQPLWKNPTLMDPRDVFCVPMAVGNSSGHLVLELGEFLQAFQINS
jgi:outer membrane protein assembly factor BamB